MNIGLASTKIIIFYMLGLVELNGKFMHISFLLCM